MSLIDDNGFYIWLSSDTASPEFPENKTNHFFTSYHSALELDNRWEVAIVEFLYPHSWYNVDSGDTDIYTKFRYSEVFTIDHNYKISTGFYATSDLLLDEINSKLPTKFLLKHNNLDGKISLTIPPKSSIQFSSKVNLLLGLGSSDNAPYENTGEDEPLVRTGERALDTMINKNIIYIYSNVIKPVIAGHYFVPLLRTMVTSPDNHGEYVNISFKTPHYLPIATRRINHIEIEIRDGVGNSFDFKFGKITVKLHFRQKVVL